MRLRIKREVAPARMEMPEIPVELRKVCAAYAAAEKRLLGKVSKQEALKIGNILGGGEEGRISVPTSEEVDIFQQIVNSQKKLRGDEARPPDRAVGDASLQLFVRTLDQQGKNNLPRVFEKIKHFRNNIRAASGKNFELAGDAWNSVLNLVSARNDFDRSLASSLDGFSSDQERWLCLLSAASIFFGQIGDGDSAFLKYAERIKAIAEDARVRDQTIRVLSGQGFRRAWVYLLARVRRGASFTLPGLAKTGALLGLAAVGSTPFLPEGIKNKAVNVAGSAAQRAHSFFNNDPDISAKNKKKESQPIWNDSLESVQVAVLNGDYNRLRDDLKKFVLRGEGLSGINRMVDKEEERLNSLMNQSLAELPWDDVYGRGVVHGLQSSDLPQALGTLKDLGILRLELSRLDEFSKYLERMLDKTIQAGKLSSRQRGRKRADIEEWARSMRADIQIRIREGEKQYAAILSMIEGRIRLLRAPSMFPPEEKVPKKVESRDAPSPIPPIEE